MSDRVSVTPEPEPSGELRCESDTGGDSQYSVVMDDIGVTEQQQVKLSRLSFDVYGQLIVRDPEVSDQGGTVLSHTQEMQAVSTVTSTGGRGDNIITEHTSHIPVTQQPVVLEPTLSDRDLRELETGSPGPVSVSGAGHEESDTHHDIDSSSSSGHRDDVTCTPPRHKPFVPDPQRQL